MTPQTFIVDLKKLPKRQRDKICTCYKPCGRAITLTTYNDGMMMCFRDARRLLFNLNELLDVTQPSPWTDEEEQVIIREYQNGVYNGINRHIANLLGREYGKVKAKARRMRDKGLIP